MAVPVMENTEMRGLGR